MNKDRQILKFMCEHKIPNSQTSLRKNNVGDIACSGFKLYDKTVLLKAIW